MFLSGVNNLDYSALCGLGAITKVFSQQEAMDMAAPFIGLIFGDRLAKLVGKIYSKYRLVQGSSGVSAAAAFKDNMGGAGGYVASTLGWGDAFSNKAPLKSAFESMAADWQSRGIEVVLTGNAVPQDGGDTAGNDVTPTPSSTPSPVETPAQTTLPIYETRQRTPLPAAATYSVPTGRFFSYLPLRPRARPYARAAANNDNLFWMIGIGAVLALAVGLMAAKG